MPPARRGYGCNRPSARLQDADALLAAEVAALASSRAKICGMPRKDANVVWSSSDGDLRRARPAAATPAGVGRVRVRREVAGRRGKAVTTVAGVPLADAELRALAGRLKKRCGVGGSTKDGVIELQGDHRDAVVELLRADGYDVVLAGG
jgi:translation initiation factor 1